MASGSLGTAKTKCRIPNSLFNSLFVAINKQLSIISLIPFLNTFYTVSATTSCGTKCHNFIIYLWKKKKDIFFYHLVVPGVFILKNGAFFSIFFIPISAHYFPKFFQHFAHWWGLAHAVFLLTDATFYLWIATSCYSESFPCFFRSGMGRLKAYVLKYIQAVVLIVCLIFFFIPLINIHKYIWGFFNGTELSFHRNFLQHNPFSNWW